MRTGTLYGINRAVDIWTQTKEIKKGSAKLFLSLYSAFTL